jgi:hypothetical protein
MVSHPPMFSRQAEEQDRWDDGFKAGLKEALDELAKAASLDDLASPTHEWVKEFSLKIENKYL